MEFEPQSDRQMAGILYFYDEEDFYYLRVTREGDKKILDIMQVDRGQLNFKNSEKVVLRKTSPVWLRVEIHKTKGQFYFSEDGEDWREAGRNWEADKISDEYPDEGAYTGAMLGIGCHDMLYRNAKADFEYIFYQKL